VVVGRAKGTRERVNVRPPHAAHLADDMCGATCPRHR
jgi:hypothetical protein